MSKTPENKLEAARRYRAKKRKDPKWRAKQSAYMKAYRAENRERIDAANKERQRRLAVEIRLQRKGLDPKKYADHIRNHNGHCDICGRKPDGRWKALNIDHCHGTGRFRGMLCFRCNRALGYFGDDPEVLRAAIRYLKRKRPR